MKKMGEENGAWEEVGECGEKEVGKGRRLICRAHPPTSHFLATPLTGGDSKADDRRTLKSADFCMLQDRFYWPILSAINLAVELGSNFADKIGRQNGPILSFVCHRLNWTCNTSTELL